VGEGGGGMGRMLLVGGSTCCGDSLVELWKGKGSVEAVSVAPHVFVRVGALHAGCWG
jgi:hypothetical protein